MKNNQRLNLRLLTEACHNLSHNSISSTLQASNQRFNRFRTKDTIQSSRKLLKSNRKMGNRIETI